MEGRPGVSAQGLRGAQAGADLGDELGAEDVDGLLVGHAGPGLPAGRDAGADVGERDVATEALGEDPADGVRLDRGGLGRRGRVGQGAGGVVAGDGLELAVVPDVAAELLGDLGLGELSLLAEGAESERVDPQSVHTQTVA
jgi:hypothetical protein